MDIEYLLTLQGLRETLGSAVESFFVAFSLIGDGPVLVAFTLIIYWCVDKRAGQLAMVSFAFANFIGQLIKNIACVYRPWILDPRITPAEGAIEGAGGFSFPSGHTTGSCTVNCSLAWSFRYRWRWLSIVLVIIFVIIAFGRNYLGVHTPQDVLVAIALALVMIWLANKFLDWIDEYPEYEVHVVVIVFVLCVACLAIVGLKPYPIAYDASGQPLIDVVKMQKGSFEGAGILLGWALGWLFERRMVEFDTDSPFLTLRDRLIRGVVGVGFVGVAYLATDIIFKAIMPYTWAKFFAMLIVVFVALFIAPLVFSAIERRHQPQRW